MKPEKTAKNKARRRGAWALWIGVVLMFLLVITAWTILIKVAKDNPVETIDLEETSFRAKRQDRAQSEPDHIEHRTPNNE